MSRNMKDANTSLFAILVAYCEKRNDPISDISSPRWVQSNKTEKEWLKYLSVIAYLSFGRHRYLTWLRFGEDGPHYIGLVGFEYDPDYPELPSIDVNSGLTVSLISELGIQPNAPTSVVRNVVEVGAMGDPGYEGHDQSQVASLFPMVKALRSESPLDDTTVWPIFLRLSVDECRLGSSWIDDELAASLSTLAALNVPSLPYAELCRSVFDLDPRSLFMSLYRCIEATYAFDKSTKLGTALDLEIPWYEIAAVLDSKLGWHPQEASSLNVALKHANRRDLAKICRWLEPGSKSETNDLEEITFLSELEETDDLEALAGRAIYKLRNQIVHYRPSEHLLNVDAISWNPLCNTLVSVALDVFSHAYND